MHSLQERLEARSIGSEYRRIPAMPAIENPLNSVIVFQDIEGTHTELGIEV